MPKKANYYRSRLTIAFMLLIAARLWARYTGRVTAELSPGDALLLIRNGPNGDGSVLIISSTSGVLPRNWMPAGSSAEQLDRRWVFTKGQERLEVYLDQVYFQQEINDQLDAVLQKTGTEAQISDYLAANLQILVPELPDVEQLYFQAREHPTAAGPIDLLASDDQERFWLIEVKRRKCTVGDVYQLRRYQQYFTQENPESQCQGLLIGPGATRGLRQMLADDQDPLFPLHLFIFTADKALLDSNRQ